MTDKDKVHLTIRIPLDTTPIEGEDTIEVKLGKDGYRITKVALDFLDLVALLTSVNTSVQSCEKRPSWVTNIMPVNIVLEEKRLLLRRAYVGTWNVEPLVGRWNYPGGR